MIPSLVLKNIRKELFNYAEFMIDIDNINKAIFENKEDYASKSTFLVVNGFISRVYDILYLINLNYVSEDKIITLNFQNLYGANILLRGVIESTIILDILRTNQNLPLFEKYYNQMFGDNNDMVDKFDGQSKYFLKKAPFDDEYSRYSWLKPLIKKKVVTLADLVNVSSLSDYTKGYYINEILHNNNLSHPKLKNDSVIRDGLFGTGNVSEIIYFFETITTLSIDLINTMIDIDKKYGDGSGYSYVRKIKRIPKLDDYFNRLQKDVFDYPEISKETSKLLKIREKNYDTDISHADTLQFGVIISFGAVMRIKDEQSRKQRCLDKYLESLMLNIQELALAFENDKPYIFFTKLRYGLELMSTIDVILDWDENGIEMYQVHTDILTNSAYQKIPKVIKDYFRDAGLIKQDPNKVEVTYGGVTMSVHQMYLENLKFMKEYYKKEYSIDVTNKTLKHVNGWAIRLFNDSDKPPSNLNLIRNFISKNKDYFDESYDGIESFLEGLYTLICAYCHATSFSSKSILEKEYELYIDEAYYYLIKFFEILMLKIEKMFPSITDLLNTMKSLKDYNEKFSYKYSINEILKEMKNNVIIN